MFGAFILPFYAFFWLLAIVNVQRRALFCFSPTAFNQFLNKFYNFV